MADSYDRDKFSFNCNLLPGEEPDEERLAFGEWSQWNHSIADRQDSPEWLARDDDKLLANHSKCSQYSVPASRVEKIDRFKKEMLDIYDVPEYAYDLSLRDLVELPKVGRTATESQAKERLQKNKPLNVGAENVKKAGRRHSRSESMEKGDFLLTMFFPIPSPGKKRSSGGSTGSSKASRRSTSSGSSKSDDHSWTGSSKSSNNARSTPKTLVKGGGKPGACRSLEDECAAIQHHEALSRTQNLRSKGIQRCQSNLSLIAIVLFQASEWLLSILLEPKETKDEEGPKLRRLHLEAAHQVRETTDDVNRIIYRINVEIVYLHLGHLPPAISSHSLWPVLPSFLSQ